MARSKESEKKHEATKKRYNIVLTLDEGEQFDALLKELGCTPSALIKKICRKELVLYQRVAQTPSDNTK
jgi:hypothetical protein